MQKKRMGRKNGNCTIAQFQGQTSLHSQNCTRAYFAILPSASSISAFNAFGMTPSNMLILQRSSPQATISFEWGFHRTRWSPFFNKSWTLGSLGGFMLLFSMMRNPVSPLLAQNLRISAGPQDSCPPHCLLKNAKISRPCDPYLECISISSLW